jgi:hypothetical protein
MVCASGAMEFASRPPMSPATRVGGALSSRRSSFFLAQCSQHNHQDVRRKTDRIRYGPSVSSSFHNRVCSPRHQRPRSDRRANDQSSNAASCRVFSRLWSAMSEIVQSRAWRHVQVENGLPQPLSLRVNDGFTPIPDPSERLDDRAFTHLQAQPAGEYAPVQRACVGHQGRVDGCWLRGTCIEDSLRLLKVIQDLVATHQYT